MNVHDGHVAKNIAATTDAFTLRGGRYQFLVSATFNDGSVGVEALAPDGATWVACADPLEANGAQVHDLSPGTYRIAVDTATAVNAALVAVPY
jgi:hypothetical protein